MFRNKEYVLAVHQEKSFSKAAQRLYISQPSLSASIKRIEDKLGVPIFDRSTQPVTLTEIGEEYVRYALEMQEKEQAFERYVSDHTQLLAGTVRLGGSSLFSSFILPSMIMEFAEKYPQIHFELTEDNTKNLMEKLGRGELDLVVDNAIVSDENILSQIYTTEQLMLAVPVHFSVNQELAEYALTAQDIKADRHLSSDSYVDIASFAKEDFIFLNPENDTGKRANRLFKKYGLKPQVMYYLDQQVTSYNIAGYGLGIAFVSDTLVKYMGEDPYLKYYKLADSEMTRNIYFYYKNNHYLSLACQKFLEFTLEKKRKA